MLATLYNNIQIATFVVGMVAALGISLLHKARAARGQAQLPAEPSERQRPQAYTARWAAGAGLIVLALGALVALIAVGINLQQPISAIGILIGLMAGLALIWFVQTRSDDRGEAGKNETKTPER